MEDINILVNDEGKHVTKGWIAKQLSLSMKESKKFDSRLNF